MSKVFEWSISSGRIHACANEASITIKSQRYLASAYTQQLQELPTSEAIAVGMSEVQINHNIIADRCTLIAFLRKTADGRGIRDGHFAPNRESILNELMGTIPSIGCG